MNIRYLTAGESHGKALVSILEGIPKEEGRWHEARGMVEPNLPEKGEQARGDGFYELKIQLSAPHVFAKMLKGFFVKNVR